jgi:RNA polymerase sigma factor (sigma-70 family)
VEADPGEPKDDEWLAYHFERYRPHLRAVAYRMLGSRSEADDAVQDAWLRLSRSGADGVENIGGWLTTMVARACMNMLRSRVHRREEPLDAHEPEFMTGADAESQPEDAAVLSDSVGLALLVVLDTLTPEERLAFVLHDTFGLPFDEIGAMVDRSPAAARQLASRARRRVKGGLPARELDPARQRAVVDAFYAAARGGDFEALIALLHPGVVARSDSGTAVVVTHGAEAVARQALLANRVLPPETVVHPAELEGSAAAVVIVRGEPFSVMTFTVADGQVTEISTTADPRRVAEVASAVLGGR